MIKISKSAEPGCLTQLKAREDIEATYDDLEGECKEVVCNQLSTDQEGLCAYCQRSLKSVEIEHYIPQTKDPTKVLDYTNFFGVCSGSFWIDKMTGEKIVFCESHRGSTALTINPEQQEDIDTIYFDEENRIKSSNETFNRELDEILHLNFIELCEERQHRYRREMGRVVDYAMEYDVPRNEALEIAIGIIEDSSPKIEHCGLVLYRFRQFLE